MFYCAYNVPNVLQIRSPAQIKNEIAYLKDRYSIQGVLVKMSSRSNPKKYVQKQNAIQECDVIWRGQTTTLATYDQLKHAADSKCLELAIGVETADESVMKIIDKTWQDRAQIMKFGENARKVGIKIKVCLILGLPGEPLDIVKKTINLLEELDPNFASVSGFLPSPGSPIASNPKKYGIKKIDKNWQKYSHLLLDFQMMKTSVFHLNMISTNSINNYSGTNSRKYSRSSNMVKRKRVRFIRDF